ncbi:hypothetical protein [Caballeronia pedi]|uniref:hypothetical protein n=1 Tax=Caballeronia pedi TaxID=1777141 RepID=UPI003CC6D7B4
MIGRALKGEYIDTFASMGLAFIVNASLLVDAAALFHVSRSRRCASSDRPSLRQPLGRHRVCIGPACP